MNRIVICVALLSTTIVLGQQQKKDSTSTSNIEEVTFTKKNFHKKSDRFVYEVAKSPVAKGSTVFNLLKETPLLSSTDDKTLQIAGKSDAVIYLNGRKVRMDADALTAFLKNTPAENIKSIEVITTPGSEFDVEASQGIINIILKKAPDNGLSGSMRLVNEQAYNNSTSSSVSLNYRKNKLGINANLRASEDSNHQYYILRNGNQISNNQTVGNIDAPDQNYGGYLNIDYSLTEKSNLAFSYNTNYNKSKNQTTDLFNTVRSMDENHNWKEIFSRTQSNENNQSYNNSANLNYELKTDSLGSKLNLNIAYLNFNRSQNGTNTTYNAIANGTISPLDKNKEGILTRIVQNTPQVINNLSGMASYVHKFKKDFTFAAGGNINHTKTDNDLQSYTDLWNVANSTFTHTLQPNHFIYTENILGLYVTLEKVFSPKWSTKVGVRYEMTKSKAESMNQTNTDLATIDRNYNDILPYVTLNYAINPNHNLSYAFSSRVRRPSFWELNPVREYTTQYNYIQNNPFVKAATTYSQELTYMYKGSYFLIASHKITQNPIQQIPLQREREVELTRTDNQGNPIIDPVTQQPETYKTTINELRYIRTNFGKTQSYNLMLGMQKSFFKNHWNTNINVGIQRNILKGLLDTDPITGDRFPAFSNNNISNSFLIQTNNNIQLDKNKTWYAGVNFWYVSKQQIELGELDPLGSLNLSIKKIWGDWTFMGEITDVLKTSEVTIHEPKGNENFNYVNQNQYHRSFELSITYNFGNKKVKKVREIESANDAIKNRTR